MIIKYLKSGYSAIIEKSIVSEKEAKALKPDYFMVLPWHFKQNIIFREETYLRAGGKLIFPLPAIQTVAR